MTSSSKPSLGRPGVRKAIDLLRSGEFDRSYGGLVSVERHPMAPLVILNYTEECQYRGAWDEVTTECRGLVVDTQRWTPPALPFPKFFNFDECPQSVLAAVAQEPFTAFEKLDGSLGILYPHADSVAIATRGSFVSREALAGTKALAELRPLCVGRSLPTLLFEMLLDTGPSLASKHASGLVLLAGFDVETGAELPWDEVVQWAQRLGCAVPKVFEFGSLDEVLAHRKLLPPSEEGYVVRFRSGVRVKVKGEWYLRALRGDRQGLAEPRIVKALESGTLEALRRSIPEELLALFDELADRCSRELALLTDEFSRACSLARDDLTPKEFALWVKSHVPGYLHPAMFAHRAGSAVDWYKTILFWRAR